MLQIMRNAAETLTPVTLELGGKDAFIICEDTDVSHVSVLSVSWCSLLCLMVYYWKMRNSFDKTKASVVQFRLHKWL